MEQVVMKKFILRWAILVVSLIVAAYLTSMIPGLGFSVDSSSFAAVMKLFIGVAVLAVLNATLGGLLKVLTLPLNCMTLGLFSLVINAAMLMLAASLGLGFKVEGFPAALVGSILMSACNAVLGSFIKDEKEEKD
ncbi:MAG: phage holin family protein [Fimbriimonadaceae bacterium]|nr:phage holin family protein [Armatimonadota bacterium]